MAKQEQGGGVASPLASLSDRVDAHFAQCNLALDDVQGMCRHVLDCLGALRVRSREDRQMTPAIKAVFKGAVSTMMDQIEYGQDETFDDGSAMRHLMDAFPDQNKKRDARGWLPLHWAAALDAMEEEYVRNLTLILPVIAKTEHQVVPKSLNALDASTMGLLPLHFACAQRHPRIENIKSLLMAYPEAIRIPDARGWLPLHWAARNCMSLDVVNLLLEINPRAALEPTARGQLPFLLAMANKRIEVVEVILDANPDAVDSIDSKGDTALHYAAKHCNPDAAKRVLAINPDIAVAKNFKEQLPIHKAFSFIRQDATRLRWRQLELLRIILDENPETVSQQDKDGNLPLHLAVSYNSTVEVVEAIYSVFPTAALIPDKDGNLPVQYASSPDVQKLLFGASPPLQRIGLTSSFSKFV